jgi:hypothetical protein
MGLESCQYMGVLLYYHLKEPKGSERNGKTQTAQNPSALCHLCSRRLDCISIRITSQVSYTTRKTKPLMNQQILGAHDMIIKSLEVLYHSLSETVPNTPWWHNLIGQIKAYRLSLRMMGVPYDLIPNDPYNNFVPFLTSSAFHPSNMNEVKN